MGSKILQCAIRGDAQVYFGLEGWMLATVTAGMSECDSVLDALAQVLLGGLLRLVALFYLMDFRGIVRKVKKGNDAREKEKGE